MKKRGLNAHGIALFPPRYWILSGSKADEPSSFTNISLSILQHPLNVSGEINLIINILARLTKTTKSESHGRCWRLKIADTRMQSTGWWKPAANARWESRYTTSKNKNQRLEGRHFSSARKMDQSFCAKLVIRISSWETISRSSQTYRSIPPNAQRKCCTYIPE